jgi:hypothetical protein
MLLYCRTMLSPLFFALQVATTPPQPVYHARNGQTDVRATASDARVVIDGILDEPVWAHAALLTGFSLYSPVDQRPAPDSTEVLVWYSPTAIYFGIRAYEPHGIVRATLADRDRISADDNIEIHLDTFLDRRRAFVFIVNPLGVQADGTKSEGGGFTPGSNVAPGQNDLSPDFRWESKGHVTEWGYEVELRIPFSSVRYPVGNVQRWGLQFDRHVQHSGYEETWTPVLKASASFIVQEGLLGGLTGLRHGQQVAINPELSSTVSGAPCCGADGRAWSYSSNPQLGGNVRWGIGSNFVLNGTVKPDFSQVEADAAQIAADQRFALFYAEKRPFFVEGSEQFNVPNTLVYTRTIVRPDAAAKLTGLLGSANLAFLSALDQPLAGSRDRPLVDVVRLQQAFGGQSTAGLLYSDRVSDGRTNRAGGADVRWLFGKMYYAQFQGVASTTRVGDSTSSGPMWEAVVDRTGRSFGFHYNVLGIHPDFRADNGFVPRTGIVQPSVSNRFTAYGAPGALIERYNVFVSTNAVWRYSDFFDGKAVLEERASSSNSLTLRGGWSLTVTPAVANFAFDPAAYTGTRVDAGGGANAPFVPLGRIGTATVTGSIATPQFRRFAASAGAAFGNDVDFLEASHVRRADYNASLDLRPSERLRISGTYVSTSFTRRSDGVKTLSTRIPRAKVEYQLGRPIFVRLERRVPAFHGAPLEHAPRRRPLLVPAFARHGVLRGIRQYPYRGLTAGLRRTPPHERRVLREGELRVPHVGAALSLRQAPPA